MELHKFLDSKQREQLLRDVERDATIPFTVENIKATAENVFASRKKLFEQSVANVFDALIGNYKGNSATEGWKTNDNYRVNRKLIWPYGVHFDGPGGRMKNYCSYKFEYYHHYNGRRIDLCEDLDRVLCVLAGERFEECYTINTALRVQFEKLGEVRTAHFDNKCESQFFHCQFWKKSTLHLTFKDEKLWERFNITAAAGRA
jgi:hypothetical protein